MGPTAALHSRVPAPSAPLARRRLRPSGILVLGGGAGRMGTGQVPAAGIRGLGGPEAAGKWSQSGPQQVAQGEEARSREQAGDSKGRSLELCQRQGARGFGRGTGQGESLRVSRRGSWSRGLGRALLGCPKVWAPSVPPLPGWAQPTIAHLGGVPSCRAPLGRQLGLNCSRPSLRTKVTRGRKGMSEGQQGVGSREGQWGKGQVLDGAGHRAGGEGCTWGGGQGRRAPQAQVTGGSPADRQRVQPGGDKDVPLVKGQLWGTPRCPGPGPPLPHEGLPPSRGPGPPTRSWHLRGLLVPEPSAYLSPAR